MSTLDPSQSDKVTPAVQFLRVLRAVERMPLPDLVFHQAQRIETLVRHARANVPYYRSRLAPLFDQDDVLDLSRWRNLPIMINADARANATAMKASSVPPLAGAEVADQTTGTGGSPFYFSRSTSSGSADAANTLRLCVDHGFDANARFADLRIDTQGAASYPTGRFRREWAYGTGTGDYAALDISTPLADQVEWLLRVRPRILFTWATNARAIALRLEAMGEPLGLTSLATSAEVQTAGVRRDCRRVFGLDPVDVLGARECGILAWRCHAGPLYHLTAETTFTEVITDDGRPAEPGENGRLVVTPFYNFHMPFIRYATGDYATVAAERCPCGRSLPALSAVLGRDRNRVRLPDGVKRFPDIPEEFLDATIGPLTWQLVQERPDLITVAVEPAAMSRAERAADAIAAAVRAAMGASFRVDIRAAAQAAPGTRRKKRELFRAMRD